MYLQDLAGWSGLNGLECHECLNVLVFQKIADVNDVNDVNSSCSQGRWLHTSQSRLPHQSVSQHWTWIFELKISVEQKVWKNMQDILITWSLMEADSNLANNFCMPWSQALPQNYSLLSSALPLWDRLSSRGSEVNSRLAAENWLLR